MKNQKFIKNINVTNETYLDLLKKHIMIDKTDDLDKKQKVNYSCNSILNN